MSQIHSVEGLIPMSQITDDVAPSAATRIADDAAPVIDLTERAASEILRLINVENLGEHYLRVGVQGGGCSGLQYSLNFDTQVEKFDKVFDVKGVRIVIDLKSALYLQGTTLDYIQSLTGGGFKFSNPNASRSCGCGTSFSA
jgi:iron-sulfur cluster assembly protein